MSNTEYAHDIDGSIIDRYKVYMERLKEIQKNTDIEIAHSDADDVLCDLLTELGYGDIVNEYKKIERWYA